MKIYNNVKVIVKNKGITRKISAFKIDQDQCVCSHQGKNEILVVGVLKKIRRFVEEAAISTKVVEYLPDNQDGKFTTHVGFCRKRQ